MIQNDVILVPAIKSGMLGNDTVFIDYFYLSGSYFQRYFFPNLSRWYRVTVSLQLDHGITVYFGFFVSGSVEFCFGQRS